MTNTPPAQTISRGRRWLVRAIVVVATAVAVASIFAVWANRQVLDADNWATTSSQLLQNDNVKASVSDYLVDQVYQQTDVAGEVAAALPPRLDPLAGPAASALRQFAENRTEKLLGRPRVQQAWENANRVTMQQFIDIAEGNSRAVTVNGDAVVLNLRTLLTDLVTGLGGSGKLVGKIPPDAGNVTVMTSDQVSTLQNSVSAVRGLSAVLPAIAILLYALAVYLSPGRRRRTLMNAGFGFIAAGVLVLIGRNVAGGYVVDSLTNTAAMEPTAQAIWSIGTNMLRDVAQAAIVIGIPVVAAAWVAGPARGAVAIRRAAAPWLTGRPGVAYGVLAAVLLLVIAWGPIPATRMVLPVLLMIGLSIAGLEVLRRQVAVEFPGRTTDEVRASVRSSVSNVVSAARRGNGAKAETAAPGPVGTAAAAVAVREATATAAPPQESRLEQLERLAALHDRGALSDQEFAAEKRRLTRIGPPR